MQFEGGLLAEDVGMEGNLGSRDTLFEFLCLPSGEVL